jgi:hypothetical protein
LHCASSSSTSERSTFALCICSVRYRSRTPPNQLASFFASVNSTSLL